MFDINAVTTWIKDNQIVLGLLASAVIGTMPETLPAIREFPQWAWTWLRDSAKTFLNFRNLPQVEQKKTETKQEEKKEPQLLKG